VSVVPDPVNVPVIVWLEAPFHVSPPAGDETVAVGAVFNTENSEL